MVPRLYTTCDLSNGQSIALLDGQNHYLKNVLRLGPGDRVCVFNGRDGEWCASVESLGKKSGTLMLKEKVRAQIAGSDLWCLFAPIKRGRLEWVVEKATELGASLLQPVVMQHCEVRKLNGDRLFAHAVEAAEQCERMDVPELCAVTTLSDLLETWPERRKLIVCVERDDAVPIMDYFLESRPVSCGVLTGPEGGFSQGELALLKTKPYVVAVSLGSRILRADTAVCAALSCWQAMCGDWRDLRKK